MFKILKPVGILLKIIGMEFMEFTFKNQKYGKIHDPGCNFLNDF